MGTITLRPGISGSLSGFALYVPDLLPSVTSFHGGKLGACSYDISEYAFQFVRLKKLSVGGLSLDDEDCVPVL